MIQEIIVYIIIILSVLYIALQFYLFFKNNSKSGCNCTGCDLNPDVSHIKFLIQNKTD